MNINVFILIMLLCTFVGCITPSGHSNSKVVSCENQHFSALDVSVGMDLGKVEGAATTHGLHISKTGDGVHTIDTDFGEIRLTVDAKNNRITGMTLCCDDELSMVISSIRIKSYDSSPVADAPAER